MKINASDIVEALKDSEEVEVSSDKKKVRRVNNAPLPAKPAAGAKKRDVKSKDKED